ncbi:MAG: polysaccharide biosynthesis/export family protein [Verrucomicrobiia bacterium]|jgi:polysaccharide export outer membrane protein
MKKYATTIVDTITGFIHRTHPARLMLGLMALLAFTGCQTPVPKMKDAGAPSAYSSEAVALREGDVLKISFPGAPNLDTTQPVRADGKIALPVVGEIIVAGMTPAELEKDLINRYSSQLLSKEVRVAVESSSFVVYVTGAVLRPGKVSSSHSLSALEAIMEAGGPDYDKANLKAVKVIRHEGGQPENYTVNLKLEMQGKAGAPFPLKPSDIIFVPEKFVWF